MSWKVAEEAFTESFHVITTHPQLRPGSAGVYRESKVRHFHHLLDRWLADPGPDGGC